MKKRGANIVAFAAMMLLFIIGSATNVFAVKLNKIGYPAEGYYYIHTGFGNDGDKLYYDKNANWKWIKWGKEDSIWYLRKDENTGAYRIELAEDSSFKKNVKTKTINKQIGKIKINVKKFPKNTTYYVRARYTNGKNVTSKWSKVKKFTTKK